MTNKKAIFIFALLGILALALATSVQFTYTGNNEGIFLLRGKNGYFLELKDDLYLNEGYRYIQGIDFGHGKRSVLGFFQPRTVTEPCLSYEWNDKLGDGYVRNYLPNGKQLLTCFSRFVDDGGREVSGLFVGGGLPDNVRGSSVEAMNETGMAFYDGKRWFHIWCNVNEAIFSTSSFSPIAPSAWKYQGSRVLHHEDQALMLQSSHEAVIDGVPLRIDRFAHFRAGETYFVLSWVLKNIGDRPVTYSYQYGDEPWLGDYGSSRGNVGWAADGLHPYAGKIDTTLSYAGFFDYGNSVIGEKHDFTMVADFLEWFGNERPVAYFTNGPFEAPHANGKKIPLSSNTRFIGVLWGPRTLMPNESTRYTLAIGMAGNDPVTDFPVKPRVDLVNFP